MKFQSGQSGNPAGRPKKLLRRVDEVLHGAGVDPVAKIVALITQLERQRFQVRRAPKGVAGEQLEAWKEREVGRVEAARKACRDQQLKLWFELLPYVHAPVKDAGEPAEPPPAGAERGLSGYSTEDLVAIALGRRQLGGASGASSAPVEAPEKPRAN